MPPYNTYNTLTLMILNYKYEELSRSDTLLLIQLLSNGSNLDPLISLVEAFVQMLGS